MLAAEFAPEINFAFAKFMPWTMSRVIWLSPGFEARISPSASKRSNRRYPPEVEVHWRKYESHLATER
jgi:hypothetical protein